MDGKRLRFFAFGGNDLASVDLKSPQTGKPIAADIPAQWKRTAAVCRLLADIIEEFPEEHFILTHGNGPQVGAILMRAEYSRTILPMLPLDVCGADAQGAMGYMLAQLSNELKVRGVPRLVTTLVTQVVVDRNDPDFKNPTKFIGPPYMKEEALQRQQQNGWTVKSYKKNAGGEEIWRRVAPSPVPREIVEVEIIESLLKSGAILVCCGGGGIPVVEVEPRIEGGEEVYECNYGVIFTRRFQPHQEPQRIYTGIEAVIDKDLTTSLLATMLIDRARQRGEKLAVELTIFTGVDGIKLNYQQPNQQDVREIALGELKELISKNPEFFPSGSMGPKVKAAIQFLEGGGETVYITTSERFHETVKGKAGTRIRA